MSPTTPREPTSPGTQRAFDDLGTPLIATTFVVLDLETTGLRAAHDRITEIGAVKVRGGEVLGELRTFVHPGRPIPVAITAVTGITDAMVRDAPAIGEVLPSVQTFLGNAVLVAHNAPFDVGFLRAAFEAHLGEPFEPVVVDTARLARRLIRDEVRNLRLSTLARHFRSRTLPEHRALADARATVDVLHGLLERAGSLGATTLEDLRDLARSRSDRRFRRISLVHDAPTSSGVYRFLDVRGEVLYVGKATDLRSRLRSYFGDDPRRRTEDLVRETASVTWTRTPTLIEAEVREVREIHEHLPRYNRRSKRAPRPVYVAVTKEAFPRLSIVTAPRRAHRCVLGPVSSRRVAEQIVAALQVVVPVRTCTDRLRAAQDHPACVMKDLGRCGAPCDGSESHGAYAQIVDRLENSFDDPVDVLVDLRSRMLALAGDRRFERACELRTRLHALARALTTIRRRHALVAVDEIVLARTGATATDVIVVRRGRLAGSLRWDGPIDEQQIGDRLALLPLETPAGPPSPRDAEEMALLLAWCDHPATRIVRATDGYAEPVAGGRELHAADAEARRVSRALRRDQHTLSRAKVLRREPSLSGQFEEAAP